jgi:hypothetical protein
MVSREMMKLGETMRFEPCSSYRQRLNAYKIIIGQKKQAGGFSGSSFLRIAVGRCSCSLELFDLCGLGALGAAFLNKGDPVTFTQGFETTAFDCGVVDEHVAATILFDKPIALAIIEPFHSTFCHVLESFQSVLVFFWGALFGAVS